MRRFQLSLLAVVPVTASLGACAGSGGSEGDGVAPSLTVTSPERGAIAADGATVTVAGTAADDLAAVRVTVNGVEATVAPDGSFAATVTVAPGIGVIETIASDGVLEARDVRAVLAGDLVPVSTPVEDAVAARVGPAALATVGDVVAGFVQGMDLGAAGRAANPVYSTGGSCLGVNVHLLDVQQDGVAIDLVPATGVLSTGIDVNDVVVTLRADYKLACISGSSNVTVYASAIHVDGGLGLGLSGPALVASVRDARVAIDDLEIDASGVPNAVFDLFADQIEAKVEDAVKDAIVDAVPGLVEDQLAELAGQAYTVPVLGHEVAISVAPSAVELSADGLFVALDGGVTVCGGEGAVYLSTPAHAYAAMLGAGGGLGIGIADDTLNQVFAGAWAAGALDLGLDLPRGHALALLLGEGARRVELELSLPPTVTVGAEGGLNVMVGDAIVHVLGEDGGELATVALSLASTIDAGDGGDAGGLSLSIGAPTVHAQVLAQDPSQAPMYADSVEALVETAFGLMEGMIDDLLATVPTPSIASTTIASPTVRAERGFVIVEASLAPAL